MATNITYASLFKDVVNYIERGANATNDETVHAQIPRLINAAERNLMQYLKLQGTLVVLIDPVGLQNGVNVVTKPDRWRETASVFYGAGAGNNTYVPLYPRSFEYCTAFWPDGTVTDSAQAPKFYSDIDYQHIYVVPTPPLNYPLKWLAYLQPEYLDETNQTNFFSDYCGNALLYATLLEAAPFLKGDERIPVWHGMLQEQLASLAGQDLAKIFDRATKRDKP